MPSPDTPHDTRDALLNSAQRLFSRSGYHAVGVNALCQEAGVVKGSFYHFFSGKEALLEAVIERSSREWLALLASTAEQQTTGRARVMAQFGLVLESAKLQKEQDGRVLGCCIGPLASELAISQPSAQQASAKAFDQWQALLVEQLAQGVADGSLVQTVDPVATAAALLAVIQGMSTLGRCFNDPNRLTEIAQTAVKRLLPVPALN